MYNVGLCGGSSTHETYCVENMYATTCVSFLENEKNTYTILGNGNNCVRKLLTVDMFAVYIVSKRMHAIAQN